MQFLKTSNHFRTAVIALIIANIIWGAAPPIFKWALQDIGPFTLAFLRFFLATILILPFAYKRLSIEKEDVAEVFLIGFLGVTLNIASESTTVREKWPTESRDEAMAIIP